MDVGTGPGGAGDMGARDDWRLRRAAAETSPWADTVRGPRRKGSRLGVLRDRVIELVLRATGLYRRGVANALDLRLTEVDFFFPSLPAAFDGYTILHLSDVHVGKLEGGVVRAAALVTGLSVDLAVLTGDVQTHGRPGAIQAVRALEPLLTAFTARDGVLAVLGNHDGHELPAAMARLGVRTLLNEHARIFRDGVDIHIAGTDDVRYFFTERATATLRATPPGFAIALIHSPELADLAAATGHALYLTGHTHGGQIALPGGRALVTATVAHHGLASGAWRLGGMIGYTSRGIGTGRVPCRFNCRGEIALIRLRRSPGRPSAADQQQQENQQG